MSTVYDPPSGNFMKLHADLQQDLSCASNRKDVRMAQTPEEIAHSVYGAADGLLTRAQFDLYSAIRAYGDQRAAEARAEPDLTIPPKPTTLERVARAMAEAEAASDDGSLWQNKSHSLKEMWRSLARAGVERLRIDIASIERGRECYADDAQLFNSMIGDILAEKQP